MLDLSPSLRAAAIDSLDTEQLNTYNEILNSHVENKLTRG